MVFCLLDFYNRFEVERFGHQGFAPIPQACGNAGTIWVSVLTMSGLTSVSFHVKCPCTSLQLFKKKHPKRAPLLPSTLPLLLHPRNALKLTMIGAPKDGQSTAPLVHIAGASSYVDCRPLHSQWVEGALAGAS
jgi:hypothetical protein